MDKDRIKQWAEDYNAKVNPHDRISAVYAKNPENREDLISLILVTEKIYPQSLEIALGQIDFGCPTEIEPCGYDDLKKRENIPTLIFDYSRDKKIRTPSPQ